MERQTITMTEKDQQRAQVRIRWISVELETGQAIELLAILARQAWRLKRCYLAEGPAALVHGNRGRPSPHRTPDAVRDRVLALAGGLYDGANDCHLSELLGEREDIHLARVTVRRILRASARPSPRRHRPPRHRNVGRPEVPTAMGSRSQICRTTGS